MNSISFYDSVESHFNYDNITKVVLYNSNHGNRLGTGDRNSKIFMPAHKLSQINNKMSPMDEKTIN